MDRKKFLKYMGMGSGALVMPSALASCMGGMHKCGGESVEVMRPGSFTNALKLPEEIRANRFDLAAEEEVTNRRTINLTMEMMKRPALDGRFFRMNRVDQKIPQGAVEEWTFVNQTYMAHPMHIHAVQFKVVSRTGGRGLIPTESGWKDTVLVKPEERVTVRMRFDAEPGLYVYHCHILEHEDNGMMANMEIV